MVELLGFPSLEPRMPEVSLLATGVGALAGWLLGSVWYGPLFGKAWMAEHGYTAEDLTKDFNPAKTYGTMLLLSAVSAYAFGIVAGPKPGLASAFHLGALVGALFVSAAIATNYLFEKASMRLFLINGGYHTARFVLIGLAFGLWG
jgi:hypothetical protein